MGRVIISAVFVILSLGLIYSECVNGEGEVKGYPPSTICETQECAPYQVTFTSKDFEIRSYTNAIWISSGNITTVSYSLGHSAGFQQTYNYYRGDNNERFAWDKNTQPIITDVIPDTSFDSIYRVYLYVPADYQNKTLPTPYASSRITLVKLPPKKLAAVARFGGLVTDELVATALAALKKSLKGTPYESAAAPTACSVADYSTFNEVILWFN